MRFRKIFKMWKAMRNYFLLFKRIYCFINFRNNFIINIFIHWWLGGSIVSQEWYLNFIIINFFYGNIWFSNLEKRWMENHEEIFSAFQRIFPIRKTVNGKPWKNIFCFSKKFIVLSIYEILSSSIFLSIGGSFSKGSFSKNNICNFITINFPFGNVWFFFDFEKQWNGKPWIILSAFVGI